MSISSISNAVLAPLTGAASAPPFATGNDGDSDSDGSNANASTTSGTGTQLDITA